VSGHHDLRVWRLSLELCKHSYRIASHLPQSEQRGLVDQIRRSSASVCHNIAEGNSSSSTREYARFVGIARASANELRSQIELAQALDYLSDTDAREALQLADDVSKMLWSLANKLRRDNR
jgi:four helix bundle protein